MSEIDDNHPMGIVLQFAAHSPIYAIMILTLIVVGFAMYLMMKLIEKIK